jgi:hypothetical protein
MKFGRAERDNVIALPRSPSGTGFPSCAKCWQPVEGYGIDDEKKLPDGRREIAVYAECRHGKTRSERETKVLTTFPGQTKEGFLTQMALLVFFAPRAGEPMNLPLHMRKRA